MSENIEKLKSNLNDIVEESKDKGRHQFEKAKQNLHEKREGAQRFIRENPEKSVLIAAGVGAVTAIVIMMFTCAAGKCKRST